MSQIKKFIDKVANTEGRGAREVTMPITDARELRDEIMKLVLDQKGKSNNEEVITVVMSGGKW